MQRDKRRMLGVLVVAWVLVAGVAVFWGVGGEESDLEDRAQAALRAAGIAGVEVSFSGRDARLDGESAAQAEAAAAIRSLRGVRAVRLTPTAEAARADATPPTTAAPPPSTTAPASQSPTTTTTTTTTTPTTTTTVAAPTVANFTATLLDGTLTLSGAIPSQEVADGMAAVAELIYAPFLVNDLVVDPEVAPASWLAGAPRAIAVLPIVGSARLELVGEEGSLSGSAGSAEKAALLQGAVQQALGAAVGIDGAIEVTGLRPPRYLGTASGDGTVVLQGEMPDQAAIDRIADAAIQIYGAENVVDQMEIGDGVDATFSLYRVPLTFTLLEPVPQWEVLIENDVISGGLRGGATFDFESAELTPELQRLAGVAAGILLRNPATVMTIEGHTDDIGSLAFNQRLSVARAEAGVAFIAGLGVDPARLTAVGYGETDPIASNDTDAGRAQNRRLEFVMGPGGPEGDQ